MHLEQLISEQTQEGPNLDLKRQLPTAWDGGAKHELFADVSAFANAGGGDLIYGMEEDDEGRATALVPLQDNSDETTLRIADLLMTGIEQRIPGMQVQPVPVTDGGVAGTVFVIRVPQSWAGPHRVKSNFKFYIREGNRKREVDVPELRGLFLRTESQAQRIRDFRTQRLGRILTGELPCRLIPGPKWVLHVIPTQAALGIGSLNPLPYLDFTRQIPCLGVEHPGHPRINIDGALGVRNTNSEGLTHGYTQLFRDGFVEAVYTLPSRGGETFLPGVAYEKYAADFVTRIRTELIYAGYDPEMAILMSLLDADRVELSFNRFNWNVDMSQGFFDRKTVILPEVLISGNEPPLMALKPMFDLVWQAAGMQGSINFDAGGEWRAHA
ncbi:MULTISPECIES: helix-turn-helix domain-containing protein [unclassified Achromobacter]|uniref:AlbA family DNA-binding domain-containing protein n=1 Tax=unclassified Achromobacter TaxID=2626865 RepID=UPI001302FC63|nr:MULTISPECIES: ATP-binding protein [unclassified Achromobacter]